MKTGTKIGWALVAIAIFISVWVLTGGISRASNTTVPDVNGNEYVIDENGSVVSVTIHHPTAIVPTEIQGIGTPVTTIKDGAFANESGIETVDASHVTSVGDHAFAECANLASINIASATRIGAGAFSGCENLSSLTTSDLLQTIDNSAFKDCSDLVGITIPAGVTTIAGNAFDGCTRLASINVAPGNSHYTSDGLALYSDNWTSLCIVPLGANPGHYRYDVDSRCTRIASTAFKPTHSASIAELHLPASVTTWEEQAGYIPQIIYYAKNYNPGLVSTLQTYYDGKTMLRREGDDPTPTGTYAITGSILLTNGDIEIYFTTPTGTEIPDAGSVYGNSLNPSMGTIDATKLTLTKAYLDTIRPSSGSIQIPVTLACGDNNFDPGRQQNPYYFELAANPGPAPVPTHSLNPTYQEMYNNGGNFLIDVYNAAPGVISAVTVQNQGDYNLITNGYCSIAANGSGSRLTISSNYISSLTPGGTYVIKVAFNDGAAALTSKLYILTPGNPNPKPSRPSSSTSSGSGSSIVSGSGTSYTQPASSTLYGNGYTSTTTASSATGTTHTKDTTPSTADGWDARLAFAIALLLAGVVVLMLSRRNAAKLEMIRKDRE